MKSFLLAAGAAALVISAPSVASPDKGKGGKGHGQSMKAGKDRGGHGNNHRGRGHASKNEQRSKQFAKADRRSHDRDHGEAKHHRSDHHDRFDDRGGHKSRDHDDHFADNRRDFDDGPFFHHGRARLQCPPGLEKKNNGCLPPGQAKKLIGAPLLHAFDNERVPYAYRNWYRDNDDYFFRSGDGYIYRINRGSGLVDGLIPLFGAGYYAVGDPWPDQYDFYNLPYQYRDYWADSDAYRYRYGNGAIYRLDPKTAAVQSIVALLAGDLGVGNRLPSTYSVYNVPIAYRDRYYDTPNDLYRYNDGYIYRVDPKTMLITSVIDAII